MKLTKEKLELFRERDDADFTWCDEGDFADLVSDAVRGHRLEAMLPKIIERCHDILAMEAQYTPDLVRKIIDMVGNAIDDGE